MARYYYKNGEVTEPSKEEEPKSFLDLTLIGKYPVSIQFQDFYTFDKKMPRFIPVLFAGNETLLEIIKVDGDVITYNLLGMEGTITKSECESLKDLEYDPSENNLLYEFYNPMPESSVE